MNAFMSIRASLLGLAMGVLTACGGGGGTSAIPNTSAPGASSACGPAACGEVYIAVTDADGDFLSYTVDVLSLTLERADGSLVEALPVSARVDFAQYVSLSEFLTAATVPAGVYVGGKLRLDYTAADVTVEANGEPRAATVVGTNGQPLGVQETGVVLDNRQRLVVAPGRPALLTLDFDLAASHTVDVTTTPATATATPVLVAAITPVDEKELRLRGPVVSVNTTTSSYVVDVRPFHHPSARLGQVTVHTDGNTAFEINGQTYTGAAGLAALATAGTGTPTIAFGTLTTAERRFDAEIVHAGSSVPGLTHDVVVGSVLSRSGNELVVRGATVLGRDASARFDRGVIKVRIGTGTKIFKDGPRPVELLGPEAVSVGQRVQAFGQLTSANGERVVDASQGRVRMHLTHLLGTVEAVVPGQLTMDVAAIDGRRINAFDFSGTGLTPQTDADPASYEVATGTLGLGLLGSGQPVRVFGFVTPFGVAPPDFQGRTVVDYSEVRSLLGIGWGPTGTTAPFLGMGTDGLVLDLANTAIGGRHYLRVGPLWLDLLNLAASPRIEPATQGQSAFVIVAAGASRTHSDYAGFVADLTLRLDGSTRMIGFTAGGSFDAGLNVLKARTMVAILQ